jgi:predicted component of viral defense system (DUF524 family)
MPILFYSTEVQMAVADNPMFPSEDEAAAIGLCCPENLILQDWQTYFVKFYGDIPVSFPKPEAGLYTQRAFPDQLFEISFRNAVGRTRIGPVCVCVKSKKITEDLYEEMLSYIADKFSNLVFSFATPLGQNYRKEKTGKDIAYIEYLFLKKYLLDASPNLDGISALIIANPHIKLYRAFCNCSIDAVTNAQPAMLINMFTASDRFASLKNGHPLLATNLGKKIAQIANKTCKNLYPTEAVEERKHLTVDTNENRFVKHFLQSIPRRLNGLRDVLTSDKKSYLNPDIEQHLETMTQKIAAFLADPLWHDVSSMAFIPVGSQVLHRREGYRQLFQLYSLLQLTTKCDFSNKDDFQNILETKDTPTLFEYWSFFVIKEILDGPLKIKSCRSITSDGPLGQNVEPDLCIKYEGGISLWFNKTYRGSSERHPGIDFAGNDDSQGSYSHDFRPDIVIERDDKLLIFDAKFKVKGQQGGFYGENDDGSTFSWKDEDIDKMHCYREAIKGVTGAYILYPGERAVAYSAHNAKGLYEGVGALPLKPEAGARPAQRHLEGIERIIREFIKEP